MVRAHRPREGKDACSSRKVVSDLCVVPAEAGLVAEKPGRNGAGCDASHGKIASGGWTAGRVAAERWIASRQSGRRSSDGIRRNAQSVGEDGQRTAARVLPPAAVLFEVCVA